MHGSIEVELELIASDSNFLWVARELKLEHIFVWFIILELKHNIEDIEKVGLVLQGFTAGSHMG